VYPIALIAYAAATVPHRLQKKFRASQRFPLEPQSFWAIMNAVGLLFEFFGILQIYPAMFVIRNYVLEPY
jgi:hypothetical protein